jgi:hypothetical protein
MTVADEKRRPAVLLLRGLGAGPMGFLLNELQSSGI